MCLRKKEKTVIHVKQNDTKCLPIIREVGCFFRSCGLIAEYKTFKSLNAYQINKTWEWAKETGRIDEENNIRDSASIATRFLRELGDKGSFVEVGTFKEGILTIYPAYKGTDMQCFDALIQKVKTDGPIGTHFRPVDKMGVCIEDPHEPRIRATAIYYSILYKYVKGE